MTLTPRPYQTKLIDDVRLAMRAHRRVAVQSPTGSGKTYIATAIADGASRKQKRVVFIVHREELLEQTSAAFRDNGVGHGLIMAGKPTPDDNILIAMEMTLARRLDKLPVPDLVFGDEAHRELSATRMAIANAWSSAYHIGLTATPCRSDGRGLGERYDAIVHGPSVSELIRDGYLSPYKAYAPSTPDMTGVSSRGVDYEPGGLAAVMMTPKLIGDAVEHYFRLAPGKRGIGFSANVAHSKRLAAAFCSQGVAAAHLDGDTPKDERRRLIDDFRHGSVTLLFNCGLFTEGFDVPSAEVLIGARPTKSLGLHLQIVGRILRPATGKDHAIIIDHACNLARHGFPDDDFEWSLGGVKKRDQASAGPVVVQCPDCYCCHRPAGFCPECGHVYVVKVREIETVDADLVEVQRQDVARRKEQGRAQTYEELVRVGKARGMKNPHGWARHVVAARNV